MARPSPAAISMFGLWVSPCCGEGACRHAVSYWESSLFENRGALRASFRVP